MNIRDVSEEAHNELKTLTIEKGFKKIAETIVYLLERNREK